MIVVILNAVIAVVIVLAKIIVGVSVVIPSVMVVIVINPATNCSLPITTVKS